MFSLSDGGSQQTYYRILYTCWFLYKHETEKKWIRDMAMHL